MNGQNYKLWNKIFLYFLCKHRMSITSTLLTKLAIIPWTFTFRRYSTYIQEKSHVRIRINTDVINNPAAFMRTVAFSL